METCSGAKETELADPYPTIIESGRDPTKHRIRILETKDLASAPVQQDHGREAFFVRKEAIQLITIPAEHLMRYRLSPLDQFEST